MNRVFLKQKIESEILSGFKSVIDEFIISYKIPEIVGHDETGYPVYNDFVHSRSYLDQNLVLFFNERIEKLQQIKDFESDDYLFALSIIKECVNKYLLLLTELGEFNPDNIAKPFEKEDYILMFTNCIDFFEEEEKKELNRQKFEVSKNEIVLNNINSKIEWDNKTEISELIYVLFHSKRIKKNGVPIEQRELTEIFCKLFNTKIKTPTDYLNKSAKTYKKNTDGNTLMNELKGYIDAYNKSVIDKEK